MEVCEDSATMRALAALSLASLVLGAAPEPVPRQSDVTLVRLPDGGIQPQVAVDASGLIHVVYFKGEAGNGDLFYSRLAAGGSWTSPLRVNSEPGSAIATGNVRGAHLALGRNARVHVAWNGSSRAVPTAQIGRAHV